MSRKRKGTEQEKQKVIVRRGILQVGYYFKNDYLLQLALRTKDRLDALGTNRVRHVHNKHMAPYMAIYCLRGADPEELDQDEQDTFTKLPEDLVQLTMTYLNSWDLVNLQLALGCTPKRLKWTHCELCGRRFPITHKDFTVCSPLCYKFGIVLEHPEHVYSKGLS